MQRTIHKLEKDGKLIYPATITDAVIDPDSKKTVKEELTELDKGVNNLHGLITENSEDINGSYNNELNFENGTLDDATGQPVNNVSLAPKRLRSINYEANTGGAIINNSNGRLLVIVEYFSEENGNYVKQNPYTSENIKLDTAYPFFKLIIKRDDETAISVSDIDGYILWSKYSIEMENGTLDSSTGQVIISSNASKRLRTTGYLNTSSADTIFNTSNGSLSVLINYYNAEGDDYVKQIPFSDSSSIMLDKSYPLFKLILKKNDDTDISVNEGLAITIGNGGLKNTVDVIYNQINIKSDSQINLENGTLDDATGQPVNNVNLSTKRLRSINYEPVVQGTIINNSYGIYQIIIEYFDAIGGNYVVQKPYTTDNISLDSSYPYYKIIIKRTDDSNISPSDITNIIFLRLGYNLLESLKKDIYGDSTTNSLAFENGTLDSATGQVITNATLSPKRLRSVDFISVAESQIVQNSSNGSLLILINYYNEIGGNYVKQIDFSADDIVLDGSYKYYKLIVKKSNDGEIAASEATSISISAGGLLSRMAALENNNSNGTGINDVLLKSNALLLDFILPDVPAQNGTDEKALLNLNTVTVAEYYAVLNTIINSSGGYIKKEVCGKDASGTYEIWKLTLRNSTEVKAPRKVLIDANVHNGQGDPIDPAFTVLWLCKFLSEEYKTDSVARYIRNNYDFVIIPLANPWGLDNKSYGNANAVNINRNYDYNFVPDMKFNYNTTSGPSAWSEPETRYIRDMVLANKDAYFWMDLHSYGDGVRKKAFYVVAGDVLHPYNADRARRVFQYTKNLIDGIEVQWYDNYDSNGWGPAWGAKIQGIYSPNLECGNALTDGVKYSSGALTSDFYDLIGFLMFNN